VESCHEPTAEKEDLTMPHTKTEDQPERQPIERQGGTGQQTGTPGRSGGDSGVGRTPPERGPEKTGQREAQE
jgi:hypothetical protein